MSEDERGTGSSAQIHNHPTVQGLLASVRMHRRVMMILVVLALSLVCLAGWDHFLAAPPLAVMG